jgi:hypothetical protein
VGANPASLSKIAALGDTALHPDKHPSVRTVLGEAAWRRLPLAVRERFADDVTHAQYQGTFATVYASIAGKCLAQLCRLLGTPIAPHVGRDVPASVRVYQAPDGMVWERTYRFAADKVCVVSSTKQLDGEGLVEILPFGLRMPLKLQERDGELHFISKRYEWRLGVLRLRIPHWLPPGETRVTHADEGGGWFRFTLTVTHRWLGCVYFQTGRFREL